MRKIALILLVILMMVAGCKKSAKEPSRYTAYDSLVEDGKPLAMGDERDVYLFCDKANWEALKPFIQSAIEQEYLLVYPEKYFNLIHLDISEVKAYEKHRNLLFIGDLKSNGKVSQYMRSTVSDAFIDRVQKSGGDLFIAKNYASKDQITLYLLGSDALNLEKIGALQSENIFDLLLKRYINRLGYQAYQQKVIPKSFWESYPFSLQIPESFTLYSNDRTNRFVSFIYRARMQDKEIPDKFISVYYEDMPEDKVDINWLIDTRKAIAQRHFDGDIINEETLRKSVAKIAGHTGYRIVGSWINETHLIGGAFQSYGFWDDGKAYLIDNIVYFPAGDKLPILAELFALSSSFKVREQN